MGIGFLFCAAGFACLGIRWSRAAMVLFMAAAALALINIMLAITGAV